MILWRELTVLMMQVGDVHPVSGCMIQGDIDQPTLVFRVPFPCKKCLQNVLVGRHSRRNIGDLNTNTGEFVIHAGD